MRVLLLPFSFLVLSVGVFAGEIPVFESDSAADGWLRENSPYYRMLASSIDTRSGYTFRDSAELSAGMARWENGKLVIELGHSLTGAKRVSILAFELANAYLSPQHQEIDREVTERRITTAREFGIRHELIELDALRHHRVVLEELDRRLSGVPVEMLSWISPGAASLGDYQLPFAHDYIKAQEASGHTAHYYKWFARQLPPETKSTVKDQGVSKAASVNDAGADGKMCQ
jgi:hypothetical protein